MIPKVENPNDIVPLINKVKAGKKKKAEKVSKFIALLYEIFEVNIAILLL